ncbi:hypothetical protein [Rheinheimera hassiensis]|uniref:hypothetical protein n=1 Tax=Rheinheimera hassiensis TaxID=1193627 RepID=UPI001F056B67|nr:hypothetical protein [Rheinheimera hassiensis]
MKKILKSRIVAISPESGHSVSVMRDKLVQALNNAGVPYLHVGAGAKAAYAVLPDDCNLVKLEEVAVSCDAIVSGSGYLKIENIELFEPENEWIEHTFSTHPIDYDISFAGNFNRTFGLCDKCGGIDRHRSPPCPKK